MHFVTRKKEQTLLSAKEATNQERHAQIWVVQTDLACSNMNLVTAIRF